MLPIIKLFFSAREDKIKNNGYVEEVVPQSQYFLDDFKLFLQFSEQVLKMCVKTRAPT